MIESRGRRRGILPEFNEFQYVLSFGSFALFLSQDRYFLDVKYFAFAV